MHIFSFLVAFIASAVIAAPQHDGLSSHDDPDQTYLGESYLRPPHKSVVLLRAYNPVLTDHFYTTSVGEMDNAVAHLGYGQETSPGRVFSTAIQGTVPLYRGYNFLATDHFYTTNKAEIKNAILHLGYNYEGITGYLYLHRKHGSIPLYRAYNPLLMDHFYTSSKAEHDLAIQSLGYLDEGITGYILPIS